MGELFPHLEVLGLGVETLDLVHSPGSRLREIYTTYDTEIGQLAECLAQQGATTRFELCTSMLEVRPLARGGKSLSNRFVFTVQGRATTVRQVEQWMAATRVDDYVTWAFESRDGTGTVEEWLLEQ